MGRRAPGRLVKHLNYQPEGADCLKIPLRLIETESGMKFGISIKEPIEIDITHADPEEARKSAFKMLDEYLAVKWADHLVVSVEIGEPGWGGTTSKSVELSYEAKQIGTKRDGTQCARRNPSSHITDYDPKYEGNETKQLVLILDTKQNREALNEMMISLETFGRQVQRLMCQKRILSTLKRPKNIFPMLSLQEKV